MSLFLIKFIKKYFKAGAFLWLWRNIKSTCFEEHLQMAASEWEALIFY